MRLWYNMDMPRGVKGKYVPADRLIDCIDCGDTFVFTGAEQLYYRDRELFDPPRCAPCRAKKRERFARLEQNLRGS